MIRYTKCYTEPTADVYLSGSFHSNSNSGRGGNINTFANCDYSKQYINTTSNQQHLQESEEDNENEDVEE